MAVSDVSRSTGGPRGPGLDPVEVAEIDAVRDVFAAGREAGYDVVAEDVGGALCPVCRVLPDDADVNRVLGLGLAAPATEATLDAIVGLYRSGGTACSIAVAPSSRPPGLVSWLAERGFRPGDTYAALAMRVAPMRIPDSPLRVEPTSTDFAPEFARVVVEAYGLEESLQDWVEAAVRRPGWSCYAAFSGGELAAVSAMFVSGTNGWLAYAATRPKYRRLGCQRLMFAARVDEAARRGVEIVAGAPGPDRLASLLRKGLRVVYEGRNYVLDRTD